MKFDVGLVNGLIKSVDGNNIEIEAYPLITVVNVRVNV